MADGGTGEARQVISTLIVNILSLTQGYLLGWAAPAMRFLESSHSDLNNGSFTEFEVDLIDSMYSIGGLIGSLTFSFINVKFGRIASLRIISVIQFISCAIIVIERHNLGFWMLSLSRFSAGYSASGCFIAIPMFCTEIAEPSLRGVLGTFFMFSSSLGVVVAYCSGSLMRYDLCTIICMLFCAMFWVLSATYLEETPFYLLTISNDVEEKEEKVIERKKIVRPEIKSKLRSARESLMFYRGSTLTMDKNTKIEFENMRRFIRQQDEIKESTPELWEKFADFLTKAAWKSLLFGIIMIALEQFCGCFVLLFNVTAFLEKVGASTIPPDIATIGVGIGQLIGAYFAISTVEKVGRKVLYSTSAFGIAFCMFVNGITIVIIEKLNLHDSTFINMLPVVMMIASVMLANIGIVSLTFVILAEISPNEVRDEIFMICSVLSFIFTFLVFHLRTLIADTFGNGGLMLFFSLNSAMGGLFAAFYLPETEGKTLEEILRMMSS